MAHKHLQHFSLSLAWGKQSNVLFFKKKKKRQRLIYARSQKGRILGGSPTLFISQITVMFKGNVLKTQTKRPNYNPCCMVTTSFLNALGPQKTLIEAVKTPEVYLFYNGLERGISVLC